jgi:hypothetical protein
MAHGYGWDGSGWGKDLGAGGATFYDAGILTDMLGEAGIHLASGWNWGTQQMQMSAIGQGVVQFGRKLRRGLAGLKDLLGGSVNLHHVRETPWFCSGAPACALPPSTNNVYYSSALLTSSSSWIAMTTVHELAHVIDWQSSIALASGRGRFSDAWHGAPLTVYAACGPFSPDNRCGVNRWERWAEAVTVWVFGGAYKGVETARMISPGALGAQKDGISALLNGGR